MSNFIDIKFTTDQQGLLDLSTSVLSANGWSPEPADPEVVVLESVTPIGVLLADAIGQVPSAIFRKFGTDLVGVPYQPAVAATALVTVTATSAPVGTPLTIPAGQQFELGSGHYFVNVADIVIPVGTTTVTGQELRALVEGADSNGLTGAVQPVSTMADISGVTIEGTSGGGADAEDDTDYQNRLTSELTLLAPRPITADDFAVFSRNTPNVQIGRSTAIDGYVPVVSITGDLTSTSPTVTGTDTTNLIRGVQVTGTGIPAGTTVQAIDSPTQFTMSNNATATGAAVAITFGGTSNNERAVAVFVTAADGTALDATDKGLVDAYLQAHRELNFLVFVEDASYNTVNVTYSVVPYAGFDSTALVATIDATISAFLAPLSWGTPPGQAATADWLNQTTVRYNKLVGVIESVPGVDYVASLSINGGGAGVDLAMTGPAPLPQVGTLTGSTV